MNRTKLVVQAERERGSYSCSNHVPRTISPACKPSEQSLPQPASKARYLPFQKFSHLSLLARWASAVTGTAPQIITSGTRARKTNDGPGTVSAAEREAIDVREHGRPLPFPLMMIKGKGRMTFDARTTSQTWPSARDPSPDARSCDVIFAYPCV